MKIKPMPVLPVYGWSWVSLAYHQHKGRPVVLWVDACGGVWSWLGPAKLSPGAQP